MRSTFESNALSQRQYRHDGHPRRQDRQHVEKRQAPHGRVSGRARAGRQAQGARHLPVQNSKRADTCLLVVEALEKDELLGRRAGEIVARANIGAERNIEKQHGVNLTRFIAKEYCNIAAYAYEAGDVQTAIKAEAALKDLKTQVVDSGHFISREDLDLMLRAKAEHQNKVFRSEVVFMRSRSDMLGDPTRSVRK